MLDGLEVWDGQVTATEGDEGVSETSRGGVRQQELKVIG
jgi:hypothetical protein